MMATYSVTDLWQKWKLGELTVEQAFGFLLQNVLTLFDRQADQEKRLRAVEQQLNRKP